MADNNNRTPAEIASELNAIRGEVELRKELKKLTEEQLEQVRELGSLEEKAKGQLAEILDQKQTEVRSLEEQRALLQDLADLNDKSYASAQAKQILQETEADFRAAKIRSLEREFALSKDITAERREQIAKELKDLKKKEAQYKLIDKAIPDILKRAKAAPLATAQGAVIAGLGNAMRKMIKLGIQLHDTEAAFMKTTGASKEFASSISGVHDETRKYGVAVADVSATMGALHAGFTDFTFASKAQRESLTKTGAVLGRMGIGHQDFAASVQISTKALGMSTKEAGQNMLNMQKFAENIGVAPAEMAKQFAGAGDMLAKMGDQGVGAFKDLAIASKVSGMQMEKIIQLTNKFDTFEGAAEMAGKLNAAMGGNFVNAMDLMMATNPAERFEMIRDSLSSAGLEFDNMSYYQKKFYADSLGLSDVSELSLIMSGNTETLSGATEKSSQSYAEAAKRAQSMATFQEKLNMVFSQMIPIITPIIDSIGAFFTMLSEHSNVMKGFTLLVGALSAIWLIYSINAGIAAVMTAAATAPVWATVLAVMALIAAVGGLVYWLFSKDVGQSTFLEGLLKVGGAFEGIGSAMDALPDFMKGGADLTASMTNNTVAKVGAAGNPGATAAAGGARTVEKVRQPISIELKGDKLAEFVVEVIGEKIHEVNYV